MPEQQNQKPVLFAAVLIWLLAACAPFRNDPISVGETGPVYRYENLSKVENSDSLFVVLAFSGGGFRSSAFSYGVLEELAATKIAWEGKSRRLLDEVDVISSVSGGSFTAAAYGLYRDEIFRFFDRALTSDMETGLMARLAAPWNWARLAGPTYSRGDLLASYIDGRLFHGATFADLQARGKPLIEMNAIEMTHWVPFTFTQDGFDLICSDLSGFPIARAVAASSAVPGVFSPVSLESHGGSCPRALPSWARDALARPDILSERYRLARAVADYFDPEQTRYFHLLDGGISDNIGLAGSVAAPSRLSARIPEQARKIVVIVADGEMQAEKGWGQFKSTPDLRPMLDAVTHALVTRYARKTVSEAEEELHELTKAIRARRCGQRACELDAYFIYLSADGLTDKPARQAFNAIPSTFVLTTEMVARARGTARELLTQSGEFQRLLRDLGRSG